MDSYLLLWVIIRYYDSFFFFFLSFFKAAPVAYGGSQTRDQIGAAATGLHHSHSNSVGSEPLL